MVGAPESNLNAVKHGLRSPRFGLILAKSGQRFASAYADVCRLRREIESILATRKERLTLSERAKVQTILRLEMNCRTAETLIRTTPDMPAEEVRINRDSIGRWSRERDNLLAKLFGDHAETASAWDALDASRATGQTDGPQANPPAENATASPPANQGGNLV